MTASHLKGLDGEVNYETLQKFAIDYADGVMQCEEGTNSAVVEYAKASGKKFLPYQGELEESIDAINEFYDNL